VRDDICKHGRVRCCECIEYEGLKEDYNFEHDLRRKCQAEIAKLTAENEKLVRMHERDCHHVVRLEEERDQALARFKIAEEALELIAGPVEFYCEVGERSKQVAAREALAEIRGEKRVLSNSR